MIRTVAAEWRKSYGKIGMDRRASSHSQSDRPLLWADDDLELKERTADMLLGDKASTKGYSAAVNRKA
jgi:hypothetical protein